MSHDATDTTVAPAYDAAEVYALGADTDETARLQRQSEELQPEARALLGAAPRARPAARSGRDRPRLRAARNPRSPGGGGRPTRGGQAVGSGSTPIRRTWRRRGSIASSHGFANVEVLAGDARHTGLPAESFDLVHTRTLLVTIPEPAEVVAEMVRLARPGGLVASQEADAEFSICYPPLPEWDRLWSLFQRQLSPGRSRPAPRAQADRAVPRGGLTDVGATVYASCYPAGHSRRTVIPDLVRSLHPVILGLGLAGERELADVDAAVRAHLADPRTLVMPHLLVTAWGRKP